MEKLCSKHQHEFRSDKSIRIGRNRMWSSGAYAAWYQAAASGQAFGYPASQPLPRSRPSAPQSKPPSPAIRSRSSLTKSTASGPSPSAAKRARSPSAGAELIDLTGDEERGGGKRARRRRSREGRGETELPRGSEEAPTPPQPPAQRSEEERGAERDFGAALERLAFLNGGARPVRCAVALCEALLSDGDGGAPSRKAVKRHVLEHLCLAQHQCLVCLDRRLVPDILHHLRNEHNVQATSKAEVGRLSWDLLEQPQYRALFVDQLAACFPRHCTGEGGPAGAKRSKAKRTVTATQTSPKGSDWTQGTAEAAKAPCAGAKRAKVPRLSLAEAVSQSVFSPTTKAAATDKPQPDSPPQQTEVQAKRSKPTKRLRQSTLAFSCRGSLGVGAPEELSLKPKRLRKKRQNKSPKVTKLDETVTLKSGVKTSKRSKSKKKPVEASPFRQTRMMDFVRSTVIVADGAAESQPRRLVQSSITAFLKPKELCGRPPKRRLGDVIVLEEEEEEEVVLPLVPADAEEADETLVDLDDVVVELAQPGPEQADDLGPEELTSLVAMEESTARVVDVAAELGVTLRDAVEVLESLEPKAEAKDEVKLDDCQANQVGDKAKSPEDLDETGSFVILAEDPEKLISDAMEADLESKHSEGSEPVRECEGSTSEGTEAGVQSGEDSEAQPDTVPMTPSADDIDEETPTGKTANEADAPYVETLEDQGKTTDEVKKPCPVASEEAKWEEPEEGVRELLENVFKAVEAVQMGVAKGDAGDEEIESESAGVPDAVSEEERVAEEGDGEARDVLACLVAQAAETASFVHCLILAIP